jgi:precorrin-3B methylase
MFGEEYKKRLKTATTNSDPVISEEEYIKWIISHRKDNKLNHPTNKEEITRRPSVI